MNEKVKFVLNLLLSAVLEVVLYIFLHESGHAIVGIACNAKVSAFSIIGAYTSFSGGDFTPFTYSMLHASGMLFPLILAVCYMLFFFKQNHQNSFYRLFSMFFTLCPAMTLWAWIIVPVAYMAGDTTSPDDVIHFLNTSGIHPVIVMIVTLLLFVLVILLAWKKGLLKIWLELVRGGRGQQRSSR